MGDVPYQVIHRVMFHTFHYCYRNRLLYKSLFSIKKKFKNTVFTLESVFSNQSFLFRDIIFDLASTVRRRVCVCILVYYIVSYVPTAQICDFYNSIPYASKDRSDANF